MTTFVRREDELEARSLAMEEATATSALALRDLESTVTRTQAMLRVTQQHEELLRAQMDMRQYALEASRLRIQQLEEELAARKRDMEHVHTAVGVAMEEASRAEAQHAKTRAELELLRDSTQVWFVGC